VISELVARTRRSRRHAPGWPRRWVGVLVAGAMGTVLLGTGAGCGQRFRRFPDEHPVWRDADRRPVAERPPTYFSGQLGDALDQSVLRPLSESLRFPVDGEAMNVNAMDEVPASSWYQPRLGHRPISPERLARAACPERFAETGIAEWTVTGAKPDGANPGFFVESPDGTRFLMKFDAPHQPERATAADVLGSILFWGAGYLAPCNRIAFFRRDQLTIAEDATAERSDGTEEPLSESLVEKVLAKGRRLPDGTYRGMASLFLPGRPIGPFRYQGTRGDDPNDVIPHERRRELRAARLMAAWTRRFDSREQNTLNIWVENPDGPGGWVEHYYIDFGDCFGDLLAQPNLNPRIGHAHYVDFEYLARDFFTLGAVERPWDRPRYGPGGRIFSYYAVDSFDPDEWKPGYGNPAFEELTERDAAWMARILAHVTEAHLERAVAETKLTRARDTAALRSIVVGRRRRILERYLRRLSPLTQPHVLPGLDGVELCMRDLAVFAELADRASRRYSATAYVDSGRGDPVPVGRPTPRPAHAHDVCLSLPAAPDAAPADPRYLLVDVLATFGPNDRRSGPARVHLYQTGPTDVRVVGLERPASRAAPAVD